VTKLHLNLHICEQVVGKLLMVKDKQFQIIMDNLYLLKTRKNAGKNFKKWLVKKVDNLKNES